MSEEGLLGGAHPVAWFRERLPDAPFNPIEWSGGKRWSLRTVASADCSRSEPTMLLSRPVDAHHHLWRYTPKEYAWINDEMEILRRDWLPQDLRPMLDDAGIAGAIAVQARQTIAETEWLLEETRNHPWIEGVVGWLPLASPDFPGSYEAL